MERQPDYYPNPDSTRKHVNALTADLADKIRPQLEMMPDDTSIFVIMGMTEKTSKILIVRYYLQILLKSTLEKCLRD